MRVGRLPRLAGRKGAPVIPARRDPEPHGDAYRDPREAALNVGASNQAARIANIAARLRVTERLIRDAGF